MSAGNFEAAPNAPRHSSGPGGATDVGAVPGADPRPGEAVKPTETARGEARRVADTAVGSGKQVAQTARDEAQNVVAETKLQAASAGHRPYGGGFAGRHAAEPDR